MTVSYANVEPTLRAIAKAGPQLFNGLDATWRGRSIQVTETIADFKITPHLALVHPEWATEQSDPRRGRTPIDAVRLLFEAAKRYEDRRAQAAMVRDAKLVHSLRLAIEACRAAGREELIAEAIELQRPVPRSRSLVRRSND